MTAYTLTKLAQDVRMYTQGLISRRGEIFLLSSGGQAGLMRSAAAGIRYLPRSILTISGPQTPRSAFLPVGRVGV